MKLQQIKYLVGIVSNDLNVSKTADKFFTSQPGVSRQIKLLEEELNVDIFERNGRLLTGLTPVGDAILEMASEVLDRVNNIKSVAKEFSGEISGKLTIATTHTQARYVLPRTIMHFTNMHESVGFHLKQGNPYQAFEMVSKGMVDFAIASEAMDDFSNLITFPCYSWNRLVLVKRDHPLASGAPITLEQLSKYPLVTYENGFTGRYQLNNAFQKAGLEPTIMLTASDADIIKAYVKMDLGVGVIASVAYDPDDDCDLVSIDVRELFDDCVAKLAIRKGVSLRSYMYDFIELFSPHLSRDIVERTLAKPSSEEVFSIMHKLDIPHY